MKIANQFKLGENLYGIIGKAIKDAEIAYTKNQNPYVKFALNIGRDDSQPKGKQGIIANGEAWEAQSYAASMTKGDMVFAIGSIKSHEYQGKTYNTFVCQWMGIMGKGSSGVNPALQAIAQQAQEAGISTTVDGQGSEEFQVVPNEDDLPF